MPGSYRRRTRNCAARNLTGREGAEVPTTGYVFFTWVLLLGFRPCGRWVLKIKLIRRVPRLAPLVKCYRAMRQSLEIKDPTRAPRELGRRLHLAARREIVPQKTAIITALTTSRPLCMTCVSSRAALSIAEVEAVFRSIQEVLPLHRGDGRCRACGTVGPVFSVDDARSSSPPPPCRAAAPPRSL